MRKKKGYSLWILTKKKISDKLQKIISFNAKKLDYERSSLEFIEEIESYLYTLTENNDSDINRLMSFQESVHSAMSSAEKAHHNKGQLSGISTSFTALDDLLGGLHKSDLVVLAGRPSMGKTALATNIAFSAASKIEGEKKFTIAFFSLEMSAEQLANRILAEQSKLSSEAAL